MEAGGERWVECGLLSRGSRAKVPSPCRALQAKMTTCTAGNDDPARAAPDHPAPARTELSAPTPHPSTHHDQPQDQLSGRLRLGASLVPARTGSAGRWSAGSADHTTCRCESSPSRSGRRRCEGPGGRSATPTCPGSRRAPPSGRIKNRSTRSRPSLLSSLTPLPLPWHVTQHRWATPGRQDDPRSDGTVGVMITCQTRPGCMWPTAAVPCTNWSAEKARSWCHEHKRGRSATARRSDHSGGRPRWRYRPPARHSQISLCRRIAEPPSTTRVQRRATVSRTRQRGPRHVHLCVRPSAGQVPALERRSGCGCRALFCARCMRPLAAVALPETLRSSAITTPAPTTSSSTRGDRWPSSTLIQPAPATPWKISDTWPGPGASPPSRKPHPPRTGRPGKDSRRLLRAGHPRARQPRRRHPRPPEPQPPLVAPAPQRSRATRGGQRADPRSDRLVPA